MLTRLPDRAGAALVCAALLLDSRTLRAEPSDAAPAPAPAGTDASEAPGTPATVVVRGAPPPRSASDVVLDRPLLEAAPHKNASEMLLVVPGVFVSQHGGEGKAHQIFFRGFDAIHGQDVEFWAGGAPVNDVSNIHGQGYADLNFLIPEVVRRVHSLPGTYDPRQGDFAVAGSVDFELGYEEPGVTGKVSLGDSGTHRYLLAYHPDGADPGTFGAFELYSTDGFGPSRAARRTSAIAQATYDFGRGVAGRVQASTYSGRFDSAGVLRLEDIDSGKVDRFATYDPKQGGNSSRTQVVLELGSDRARGAGEPDTWMVSPFVVFRSLRLRSNFTGYLTSSEGDSIQQLNDATTIGARASYRRVLELTSPHDVLEAGLLLRGDSVRQTQHRLSLLDDRVTDDAQSPGVDAEVRATDVAGYLDASLYPIRRVRLRGGLRLDGLAYSTEDRGGDSAGQTRSTMGAQLSPRGTLEVVPFRGFSAVASYGQGFRSPQARSLGDGETTPFTRVNSFEVGARYDDRGRFLGSLALYHTRLSDDLVFDPTTARNELVPATSRTGVAANLSARPAPWFLSNTSFTYSTARFEGDGNGYVAGERVPYVPEIVARSDLALTPTLGKALGYELRSHFGAGLTYFGRRPLPYGEFGHDAFLLDASVSLRLGPVQTGIEVFNLLDAEWFDGEFVYASDFGGEASLVPERHVTVGPPRSFLWSLSLFL
ncbi:MAG TPA: TonB-dependent receptor [Polyangiaceae bacterium]